LKLLGRSRRRIFFEETDHRKEKTNPKRG